MAEHRRSFFSRLFSSRVFARTFLLFFLCFTLPVVAIASVVMVRTHANLRAERRREMQTEFYAACDALDGMLANVQLAAHHISQARWVARLLALPDGAISERFTPSERLTCLKSVQTYKQLINSADGMAVCFPPQSAVFSDLWYDTLEAYFSIDMVFEGMDADSWRALLSECNVMLALPSREVSRLGYQDTRYVTLVQTLSPNGGWQDGSALFYFSEERLAAGFSDLLSQGGFLRMESREGEALLEIGSADERADDFEFTRNLRVSGWTVAQFVPYAASAAFSRLLLAYTAMIVLFIFVAGTSLAFALARRDYKPLYEVTRALADGEIPAKGGFQDEYSYVLSRWHGAREQIGEYKGQIGEYYQLAKRHCAEMLVTGRPKPGESPERYLAVMGVSFTKPVFRCVLIAPGESDALREDADGVLSVDGFTTLTAEIGGYIAVLCNYDPAPEAFAAFTARLDGYFDEMRIHRRLSVAGPEQSAASGFPRSYQDASRALSAHILAKGGAAAEGGWIYSDETEEGEMRVQFDLRAEETLANLFRVGDAQGAVELAMGVLEDNRALAPNAASYLFHMLLVLPFRVLDEAATRECAVYLTSLTGSETTDAMRSRIRELYALACETQLKSIQNYDDRLMVWIVQYVQDNVFEPNISLKLLSDEFSLSVSQLSRLFKRATGEGFSEWVNETRVNRAKELLRGGAPVAGIPLQCGFSNDITFRRAFKKFTGVTPSAWRDMDGEPPR